MAEKDDEKIEGWVYVFVADPEKEERFLGLFNQEQNVNFIPAFLSKEDANDCFLTMPREKGVKYELQAIHVEELQEIATENDFAVAMVDSEGKVIKE